MSRRKNGRASLQGRETQVSIRECPRVHIVEEPEVHKGHCLSIPTGHSVLCEIFNIRPVLVMFLLLNTAGGHCVCHMIYVISTAIIRVLILFFY